MTLGPSAYPSRRIGAYQNQEAPDLIINMTVKSGCPDRLIGALITQKKALRGHCLTISLTGTDAAPTPSIPVRKGLEHLIEESWRQEAVVVAVAVRKLA